VREKQKERQRTIGKSVSKKLRKKLFYFVPMANGCLTMWRKKAWMEKRIKNRKKRISIYF
jgi:hypothetical protein